MRSFCFRSFADQICVCFLSYHAVATLGCVEFFIFILHKYYKGLNIQQELVFADIHFTLFFTAVFNAFQSALLAFGATRVSERQWVRAEQLEVDHYVEIREEFERVEGLLYNNSTVKSKQRHQSAATTGDSASEASSDWGIENAETAFEFNCKGISRNAQNFFKFLRHPHLYQKHQKLLVQIRYHELRIHFLQSNNLPLKFKVCDYLKRSELYALIKLVHISTFAWLMLLGGVTLLYYFMGIVIFVTEDVSKVGIYLTWIFMGSMIFFVILSLLIYNKMKSIFSTIMRKRLTSEVSTTVTGRNVDEQKQITSQLDLFWGGNPQFIRAIIQFMQFGFAIALSILLVFWKGIDTYYAPVSTWAILICVLSCNAAFLAIMAQVLPRYTLCTSLGQLVNKPRLQDTLAQWQLEEAQRTQEQLKMDPYYDDESYVFSDSTDEEEQDNASSASKSSSAVMKPIVAAKKAISSGLNFVRKPAPKQSKTFEDIDFARGGGSQAGPFTSSSSSGDKKIDFTSETVPKNDTDSMTGQQRIRERKERRKSQSVGVAIMRNLGQMQATAKEVKEESERKQSTGSKPHSRERRRKCVSASDDIKAMRRSSSFETALLAQLVQTDTKELRNMVGIDSKTGRMTKDQRLQARRNRMKSASDGVALMRSIAAAENAIVAIPRANPSDAAATARPRDRRRSMSASASIQQMRELSLLSEEPTSFTKPVRAPRSRQSSGGVLRLEPLVEGVQADHSDSTLNIMSSTDNLCANGHPNESQPRASSPASLGSDDIVTKGTMDSESTVGDGRSDADDIPNVDLDAPKYRLVKPEPRPTLSESARYYFLSQRYRMISAVFGTVLCFFFVGMRVEIMLIRSCLMPDWGNTWHIQLNTTFWMETSWLCMFIVVGVYNMKIFRPGNVFSNKERSQFISAILDVIISSLCLVLLYLAESRRCCTDYDRSRFLADASPIVDYDEAPCEKIYLENCCPAYGWRTYGGLGNIEPFTALVALRLLRFRVAKKIVAFMDRRLSWSNLDVAEKSDDEIVHPFHPLYSLHRLSRTERQKTADTDTAQELWMKALSTHKDIVDEYGEFSVEILLAMLGIDVSAARSNTGIPPQIGSAEGPEDAVEVSVKSPPVSPKALSKSAVEKKYSHLTPEARAMILSGQKANPVRSKSFASKADIDTDLKSSLEPFNMSPAQRRKQLINRLGSGVIKAQDAIPQQVQFNLSPAPEAAESKENIAAFVAPNGRLLRSMRRCDRKLLPLLDKWTAVDVVITRWEIVYFDASDVEGPYGPEYNEEDIKNIESVRQAMIATKGGKGLRLRDVAMGRKVVGHLTLSTVDSVHVDRIMPCESQVQAEVPIGHSKSDIQVEFWRSTSKNSARETRHSREALWSKVKQDHLRVQSELGTCTLLLRYYSDLEDSEDNQERDANERENDGPLFKDNAFQWCQTIARLCGANQLKQKLPNFGSDNEAELRDYLVIVDAKPFQEHPRHMRKKSLGNLLTSVKGHANFWATLNENVEDDPSTHVTRSDHARCLSPIEEGSRSSRRSLRGLRRLSSTGDLPSQSNAPSEIEQASNARKGADMV